MLPGLAALVVVLLLQLAQFQPVERVGPLLFDAYQRARPRPYEDAPVRVVDIDEESIRHLGQWPWPRTDIAELQRRLTAAGATVVAYDIVFSEPDRTAPARIAAQLARSGAATDAQALAALQRLPDPDQALAQAFADPNGGAVLAYFLEDGARGATVTPQAGIAVVGTPPGNVPSFTRAIQPLPVLRAAAVGGGFVSLPDDSDGIVRRAPLIASQNGQLLPSLALDALRTAQGAHGLIVKASDASGEVGGAGGDVVSIKVGDFEVPTTHEGALQMWYTAPRADRVVPAWRILTGQLGDRQMQALFGGRIVFVGSGAQGLRDLVSTPLSSRELGVVVHAQAVEQMMLGRFLVRPDWAPGVETALLLAFGLLLALALPRLGAAQGALLGLVLVAAVLVGSWEAFARQRFLLDPTCPALAVLAVYLAGTLVTYWREERQRAYIHKAFDRYLSPELVRRIADDPDQLTLGGEEREMTVLFTDIRGFSRLSEKMAPQQIIRFLIAFLTPMCDILLQRHATIDKFIGDAILAFWNAPLDDPDQHANAARGALAMQARLRELNREVPAAGQEPWPGEVHIGIGLNSGRCCVGNMGSAQRLSYSLIGDTVNLASRLEGLTKYYGVPIIVGGALAEHLTAFATVPLDCVRVVGREGCETIHALVGDEAVAATPEFQAFATRHRAMFDAYRKQDWVSAADAIAQAGEIAAVHSLTRQYSILSERITGYVAAPPGETWDGVYEAKEK